VIEWGKLREKGGIGHELLILAHSVPGLLILVGTLVAWKWERIGAGLLVGVAVLVTTFLLWAISRGGYRGTYHQVAAIVWLTMALPPLLAGVLFLASWRRARPPA